MKIAGWQAFVFLLGVAHACVAADRDALLKELGDNLKRVRVLPIGTQTMLRCPDGLDAVRGSPIALVLERLGIPDFEAHNKYTYSLSSPRPSGIRGGGYPEISFQATISGTVESVECAYTQ